MIKAVKWSLTKTPCQSVDDRESARPRLSAVKHARATDLMTENRRQWHRLFGIGLTDLFADSGWRVELEKELALTSQLLDVVIIERQQTAIPTRSIQLPDGLQGLRAHNLLTYKSRHEALDAWALDELIGHYVNYRKLNATPAVATEGDAADASGSRLPPETDFQLYAVATRHPKGLCRRADCRPTGLDGVFDLRWGLHDIRLIVLGNIAKHRRNAPWELFSADIERVRHGARHYQGYRPEAERLLYELYLRYKLEIPDMPYTMADFMRESLEHIMDDMTDDQRQAFLERMSPEERLRGLPPEERLRGLPPEERLRGLPPEERLRGLPPEERLRGLLPEERLRGLSAEELRRLKDLLRQQEG
jgi:hypothetical protein